MSIRLERSIPNRRNEIATTYRMDDIQPYFCAFLIHTGADPERASNIEYILWISQKWQEWRGTHGIGRWDVIGEAERRRFERWLFETVTEGQLTLF